VETIAAMKYISSFFAFVFVTNLAFSQKINYSDDWLKQLENPENEFYKLKPSNLLEKYKSYDFVSLIMPKTEFLGYIGNDYRRIRIRFTSIKKDPNSQTYNVTGNSQVFNNKCDFTGKINIKQVREFMTFHFGIDDEYKNKGIKAQGLIIGDYLFEENKNQPHSGQFQGVMSLIWYIDSDNILRYDNIESESDSFRNNQYVGIWKDYSIKNEKTCNWGEYRIPFSGDLDIGAGEFSPDKKYYNKGWTPTIVLRPYKTRLKVLD